MQTGKSISPESVSHMEKLFVKFFPSSSLSLPNSFYRHVSDILYTVIFILEYKNTVLILTELTEITFFFFFLNWKELC